MKNSTAILALSLILSTGSPDPLYGSADPINGAADAIVPAIIICVKAKPCRTTVKRLFTSVVPTAKPVERTTEEDKTQDVSPSRSAAKTKIHKCLGLPKSRYPYKTGKVDGDGKDRWEFWLYRFNSQTYMIIDHPNGHAKGDVKPHLHGKILKDGEQDNPSDKSVWKDGSKTCHFYYEDKEK